MPHLGTEAITSEARLIVAIDKPGFVISDDTESFHGTRIIKAAGERGCGIKVGTEFAVGTGWTQAINFSQSYNAHVFADMKLHDGKSTVARTARALFKLATPDMISIHLDSSSNALNNLVSERDIARDHNYTGGNFARLIGVLASSDQTEDEIVDNYGMPYADYVMHRTEKALKAGLNGIMSSPYDIELINSVPGGESLEKIATGIRPMWSPKNDQKRVATPTQAMQMGSDFLVVGRPIAVPNQAAPTPESAIDLIIEEIIAA